MISVGAVREWIKALRKIIRFKWLEFQFGIELRKAIKKIGMEKFIASMENDPNFTMIGSTRDGNTTTRVYEHKAGVKITVKEKTIFRKKKWYQK